MLGIHGRGGEEGPPSPRRFLQVSWEEPTGDCMSAPATAPPLEFYNGELRVPNRVCEKVRRPTVRFMYKFIHKGCIGPAYLSAADITTEAAWRSTKAPGHESCVNLYIRASLRRRTFLGR